MEKNIPIKLDELINDALSVYENIDDVHAGVSSFIYERIENYLRSLDYTALEVDSAMSKRPVDINLIPGILEAVREFSQLPEAESLIAANKRVANILKQAEAGGESFANTNADILDEAEEHALFNSLQSTSRTAMDLYDQEDFCGYLKSFAVLKEPVDAFFDSVMVMADDQNLRKNRLALLQDLRTAMNKIADLSRLQA